MKIIRIIPALVLIMITCLFLEPRAANSESENKERSIFITGARSEDGRYSARVVASLAEVKVATLDEGQVKTFRWEVIDGNKPRLVVAELKDGRIEKKYPPVELEIYDCPVFGIWPVEFYDLDKDGIPEIWVRLNLLAAVDYLQVLKVYKIKNGAVKLFKEFQGASGMAKRIGGNRVEVVNWAVSDRPGIAHLNFDLYQIEIWEYKNGEFVKVSEKRVPRQEISFEELMR